MPTLTGAQLRNQLVDGIQIIVVAKTVDDHQGGKVGLLNQILKFKLPILSIDSDQNSTNLGGGKHESGPVGNVTSPNTDMIPLTNTCCQKPFCQMVNTLIEVTERPTQIAIRVDDKIMIR